MSGSARLGGPYAERRAVPRYTFIATAEIIEPATDTHISGRVSEISKFGCYVDLLNTLPKGTPIRVRITTDSGSFECAGKIIYVQENVGMGVGFEGPSPDQEKTLEAWLANLEGK
ncbi:MAG TPA: PilZ domain-containing protein [Candidatus Aquilonibacter sp.]|nr:PilZ domain-containing protein [Candidatus Aquilonibacter sp.]